MKETPKDGDASQTQRIRRTRRILEAYDIPISLVPTNADTGMAVPPLRDGHTKIAWPIDTKIRITMSGEWGPANVLVKEPTVTYAVFQVDQNGQETRVPGQHITYIDAPHNIASRDDSGDFTFRLDPQGLSTGRYVVRISVRLHARTTFNDYTGSNKIPVYFDVP